MQTMIPSRLLKATLLVDAAASGSLAVMQLGAADFLSRLLMLPRGLLVETGAFLVAYTLLLVVMSRSARIWAPLVMFVVIGNAAWAAGCAALLGSGVLQPSAMGIAFVVLQAVAVLLFAGAEYLGLRRSVPAGRRAVNGWQSGS